MNLRFDLFFVATGSLGILYWYGGLTAAVSVYFLVGLLLAEALRWLIGYRGPAYYIVMLTMWPFVLLFYGAEDK